MQGRYFCNSLHPLIMERRRPHHCSSLLPINPDASAGSQLKKIGFVTERYEECAMKITAPNPRNQLVPTFPLGGYIVSVPARHTPVNDDGGKQEVHQRKYDNNHLAMSCWTQTSVEHQAKSRNNQNNANYRCFHKTWRRYCLIGKDNGKAKNRHPCQCFSMAHRKTSQHADASTFIVFLRRLW